MKAKWNDKDIENKTRKASGDLVLAMLLDAEGETKRICPVDTGILKSSYTYNFDAINIRGEMGTSTKYAPYVEMGTVKMSARPHIRPGFEKVKAKYAARLK